ncbi:MAG TPA: hypothetical protein VNS80_07015, partial [Pseudolysinimonas sp.]|nr:hypothetical protein [Pseudolysinimonas sp.]
VGVLALMGGIAARGFATAGRVEGIVTTAVVGIGVILAFFGVLAVTRAPEFRGLASALKRNR